MGIILAVRVSDTILEKVKNESLKPLYIKSFRLFLTPCKHFEQTNKLPRNLYWNKVKDQIHKKTDFAILIALLSTLWLSVSNEPNIMTSMDGILNYTP